MATAMASVGAASGVRAYLASRGPRWLTPRRMRVLTICLVVTAVIASATLVSGSSAPSS
jgi:hypothetical protein